MTFGNFSAFCLDFEKHIFCLAMVFPLIGKVCCTAWQKLSSKQKDVFFNITFWRNFQAVVRNFSYIKKKKMLKIIVKMLLLVKKMCLRNIWMVPQAQLQTTLVNLGAQICEKTLSKVFKPLLIWLTKFNLPIPKLDKPELMLSTNRGIGIVSSILIGKAYDRDLFHFLHKNPNIKT